MGLGALQAGAEPQQKVNLVHFTNFTRQKFY